MSRDLKAWRGVNRRTVQAKGTADAMARKQECLVHLGSRAKKVETMRDQMEKFRSGSRFDSALEAVVMALAFILRGREAVRKVLSGAVTWSDLQFNCSLQLAC